MCCVFIHESYLPTQPGAGTQPLLVHFAMLLAVNVLKWYPESQSIVIVAPSMYLSFWGLKFPLRNVGGKHTTSTWKEKNRRQLKECLYVVLIYMVHWLKLHTLTVKYRFLRAKIRLHFSPTLRNAQLYKNRLPQNDLWEILYLNVVHYVSL